MYKLSFYVPVDSVEDVKQACFDAGAGRIGNYDCCSWQILGQGQFRPLIGSEPSIGEQDRLEKVSEYRVEMVSDEAHIAAAIRAMKAAHPYEEVAYEVVELANEGFEI